MKRLSAIALGLAVLTPGLVQAAATGDRARIGAALNAVGRECGACHDGYKLD